MHHLLLVGVDITNLFERTLYRIKVVQLNSVANQQTTRNTHQRCFNNY